MTEAADFEFSPPTKAFARRVANNLRRVGVPVLRQYVKEGQQWLGVPLVMEDEELDALADAVADCVAAGSVSMRVSQDAYDSGWFERFQQRLQSNRHLPPAERRVAGGWSVRSSQLKMGPHPPAPGTPRVFPGAKPGDWVPVVEMNFDAERMLAIQTAREDGKGSPRWHFMFTPDEAEELARELLKAARQARR